MTGTMKLNRVLPTALLSVLLASGAALAQAVEEPLGRNQTEGQLLPDQAEEVAPPAETRNLDTTNDDVPVTGSIGTSERPAGADDDVPDENRSISGKVQEEEAEN